MPRCCARSTRCRASISSGQEFQDAAYADQALPIACGQTISQPYVVAYMTEQLDVQPQHKVLEIGTGSGYQAAILSRLAQEVVSIERYRTLADAARARMETLGYQNVEIRAGDGLAGAPDKAPFDRIMVTAAAETVPDALVEQLADDGVHAVAARAPWRRAAHREGDEVGRGAASRRNCSACASCRCCRDRRASSKHRSRSGIRLLG